jgi:hypothetical protein
MQRDGSTHDPSSTGRGREHDDGPGHTEYRGAERGTEQSGSQGRRYGSQRSEENQMYGGRAGYGQHDQPRHQGSGQDSGQGSGQGSQRGYGQSGSGQQSDDGQRSNPQDRHQPNQRGSQQGSQQGSHQESQQGRQQGYQYGEETVGPGDYGQGAARPESDIGQRSTGYGRSDTGITGHGQSRHGEAFGERRIRGVFSGKAPKGYTRSDERLHEDINERLMHDPNIDPSDIEVKVEKGEVTLSGIVDSRHDKFEIEELVDRVMGVKEVNNNIKVDRGSKSRSGSGADSSGMSTGGATAGTKSSSDGTTSSKRASSR